MPTPRQRVPRANDCSFVEDGIDAFISVFLCSEKRPALLRKSSGDVGVDRAALASKHGRLTSFTPIARCECPDDLPLHDVIERKFPPHKCGGESELHQTDDFGRTARHQHREDGGARRDRTDDLLLAKQALSQLSYGPGRR
jgi:hypothetical protein